ncbi:MAG: protoglobin domain-containing protein [Phycisphaerae bacterium]
MDHATLRDMMRYVGFDETDAHNLHALLPYVEPHLENIVARFYDVIEAHPAAMAVFTEGDAQIARLKQVIAEWLKTVFCGTYDEAYLESRRRIGRAHVRAGLPQHYMFTSMEIIRQELVAAVGRAHVPDATRKLDSLHKLLAVELGIMLEAYKDSYTERVQAREREAVEAKLTRAEHLAELGQLAVSLAHEIKNPLAGISGAIQIIRESLGADHEHSTVLREVMVQINRLDAVVKDLLVYARPSDPRFETCKLGAVVERILKVVHKEPSLQGIAIRCVGHEAALNIEADEAKMEQLVMNLVQNAADACAHGGEIDLTLVDDDSRVVLTVADSGHGITPEILARAFEPFFTSKAKGTGLGLSICKNIVEAHNGRISIDSEVDVGTRVVVSLPRRQKPTD